MTPPEPDEPYTPPPGELAVPKPQKVLAPDIQPRQPHPHPRSYAIRRLAEDLDRYHAGGHDDMERAVGIELIAVGSEVVGDDRRVGEAEGAWGALREGLRAAAEVTDHAAHLAARRVLTRFLLVIAAAYLLGLATGFWLAPHAGPVIASACTVVAVTIFYWLSLRRRFP